MLTFFRNQTASLMPQRVQGQLGWLRGATGATLAIGLAAFVTRQALGSLALDMVWLVAPLGASAVLVFAVPASPLAQPWPVIGGNLISAAIGLGIGLSVGSPLAAASLAIGLAIAGMTATRCLHPPGGACALLCALGAAGPDAWTFAHLVPIAVNVVTLVLVGWVYNTMTGHQWPHRAPPVAAPTVPNGLSHTREDIEHVMANWDELLDVDVDDLDRFYRAVQEHVGHRGKAEKRGQQ